MAEILGTTASIIAVIQLSSTVVEYDNGVSGATKEHSCRHLSAGMRLIQPFALVWLPPTPTMAISEMPTGETQRSMEA
jgi:hypothetical protein